MEQPGQNNNPEEQHLAQPKQGSIVNPHIAQRWHARLQEGEEMPLPTRGVDIELSREMWSRESLEAADRIERALYDPRVSEIHTNAPDEIFVKYDGVNRSLGVKFGDESEYNSFIEQLVVESESLYSWDELKDRRSGVVKLHNGDALTVIMPPISETMQTVVRKHNLHTVEPDFFVNNGTMTQDMLDFLQACVKAKVNMLIVGDMGSGKALTTDTPVLTSEGWKAMGDLVMTDKVIGSDGEEHSIKGIYDQGELDVYRVHFSDGSWVDCNDEHLWSVYTADDKRRGRELRTLTLQEIMAAGTHCDNGTARYYIPLVQPVNFREKELPLDPYLVGTLLGGSATANEIAEPVRELVPAGVCGDLIQEYDTHMNSPLHELGVALPSSLDKGIPAIYKIGSVAQRIALLQGLLDTGGAIRQQGSIEFSSSSFQLAEDVRELVQSLGGVAKIVRKKAMHDPSYQLIIRLPDSISPFGLSRKASRGRVRDYAQPGPTRSIVKIEQRGRKPMRCIAVDAEDKLYVTKEYILTHNTTLLNMLTKSFDPTERVAIIEQVPELTSDNPNVARWVFQPMATAEAGTSLYDILDIALYSRIQRLIIGEIHDEGLTKMLKVMIKGSEGVFATYHAGEVDEAIERLKIDLQLENRNMTEATALSLMQHSVQLIIVQGKVDGKHRTMEVAEVDWRKTTKDSNTVARTPLFTWNQELGNHELGASAPSEGGSIRKRFAKHRVPMDETWFIDKKKQQAFLSQAKKK